MAELKTPEQNRLLGVLTDILRGREQIQSQMRPTALGTVLDLILPRAETVEKMSYGDPLFRSTPMSRIPITADKQYLADVAGMIPFGAPAAKPTQQAMRQIVREIQTTPPAGQIAYHGSPYLFKQFDPMKVGTGEGAQAYGVGAGYTAEARPVAEGYRQAVKDMGTIKEINAQMAALSKIMDEDSVYPGAYRKFKSDRGRQAAEQYDQLMAKRDEVRTAPGYLYKGDIPDEIIPSFLNWDIPIKDQSPEIKGALNEIINTVIKKDVDQVVTKIRKSVPNFKFENVLGKNVYQFVADKFEQDAKKLIKKGEKISDPKLWGQQKATELFQEKGLSGIRYLDEQSRASGTGTSNFIPFNPQDFKIEQINDIPLQDWISKGLLAP